MPAKGVGIMIMPAKRGGDSAAHACRKGLFEIFMDTDVHNPSMGVTDPPGIISLMILAHLMWLFINVSCKIWGFSTGYFLFIGIF
jgi:hypothetical protein